MVLKINGVDIIKYVAYGGLKWQRSDIDGQGAGRMMNGDLDRKRVSTKIRLDVTCRPLTAAEAAIVLTLIMPEWVTVEYTDPQLGRTTTKTMYANNNPASFCIQKPDGTEWWSGITFPLIEK